MGRRPTVDTSTARFDAAQQSAAAAATHEYASDTDQGASSSGGEEEYALAMHDFIPKAPNATCLSFRAGQVIHVLNRHETGWWDGELEGRRGWFPSNYVSAHEIKSVPVPAAARSTRAAQQSSTATTRTVTRPRASLSVSSSSSSHDGPETPPDENCPPIMGSLLHAIHLLGNAVRANRVSHFQPSTACVISCVRSVLSAAECLARESPYLKLYPTLASERKHILAELAKLVAQSRKASRELPEDADPDVLRERDEDAEEMIRLGGNVFIAVRRFLGKAEDCGVELPRPRTNLFNASSFNDASDHESRSSRVSSVRTHSRASTTGRRSPVSRTSTNGRSSPIRVGGRRSPTRRVNLSSGRKSPTSPTSPTSPVKTARSMVDLRPQRRMEELRQQQRIALEATQRREKAVRAAEARRSTRSQETEDSAESTDSSAAPLVNGVSSIYDKRHRYASRRDQATAAHSRVASASGTQSHHRARASMASSVSSIVSYSSVSSNSSSGSPVDKIAIPTQPLTPSEVFTLANAAHDALLSIIAALIGHVHTHTAHSVVREPLASLTVEVVNAADDLRTIVVGVRDFALATISQDTARRKASLDGNDSSHSAVVGLDRFKGREIVALTTAHDGLHQLCKLLLRTVGEYYDIDSSPIPASLTPDERTARFVLQAAAEERCKSATLNVATGVLRAGGECHTVVKNSLSRRFGVEGLLITLVPHPDASSVSTSTGSVPPSPTQSLGRSQQLVASPSVVTPPRVRPHRSASVSTTPSLGTVPDASAPTSFRTPQSAFLARTRRATSLTNLNTQYQKDASQPVNAEDEDTTVHPRFWTPDRGVPANSPTQSLTPSPSVPGSGSISGLSAATVTPSAIPAAASVPQGLSSDGSMTISQSLSAGSRFSFHLNDKRDRSGSIDDGAATDATSLSGSQSGDAAEKVGRSSGESFSPLLAVEEEQENMDTLTDAQAEEEEDNLITGREERVLARNSIDLQGSVDIHSVDMHSVNMHSDDETGYTARPSLDGQSSEESASSAPSQTNSPNIAINLPNKSFEEKRLRGDLPAVPRISVDVDLPSGRVTPMGPSPTTPENTVVDQNVHWISEPGYAPGEIAYGPDGSLAAATLKTLVEKMTPHDAMRDAQYSSVFFLTFRLFTTPLELVDALVERYNLSPPPEASSTEDQQLWTQRKLVPIRLRIATVIKNWLEMHWRPSTDNVALPQMEAFVSDMANGMFATSAVRILDMIKMKGDPEQADRLMHPHPDRAAFPPITPISPIPFPLSTTEVPRPSINRALLTALRSKSYSTISVLDFDCIELARQLTIMESALYCKIPSEEILEVGERPTVHIKAISTLSNAITAWVSETMLKPDLEPRKRTALLKFFIKTAERCVGLNNFSTPRAILAALDSSTISRLASVWSGLPQKNRQQLEELRKLADHARNCGYYRSRLRQTAAPAVPFMGIFLTDITFTKEGNKPTRPSPKSPEVMLINYARYNRLAKVVQDVQRLQAPYNLKEIPEVQAYLTNQFEPLKDGGNSQDLYRRSLIVEPRQNADEPKQTKASDLFGWATRS